MLCTSGLIDDVISAQNGPHRILSILLQRVASLRRRARAACCSTPAASYWLRRVLDDGGRRD